MAEVAIEVCDATPSYVEANLDYFIQLGHYCPWSAQLVGLLYDSDFDGFPDNGDADDDDDGYSDRVEAGTPLCFDTRNEDDFDDSVADDGCTDAPEQTGAFAEAQFNIGTGVLDPCGTDGWPADLVGGGFTENKVNVSDIGSFVVPVRRLNTSPIEAAFNKRWDLLPGHGALAKWINIQDLASITTLHPPMLGGSRAFGATCPFPP